MGAIPGPRPDDLCGDREAEASLTGHAKRLASLIWRNWVLICAVVVAASAALPGPLEGRINGAAFAAWMIISWCADRNARRERERAEEWKGLAVLAANELKRRDANTFQWSDFCDRVVDNLPEEDAEAVRYALDLAIAPDLLKASGHA